MADLTTDQALLAQNPELADISRQRRIADLLTTQAFQQPQGGLVSGHYVAPSWTQQLAPLVAGIAGQQMNKQLDEKQLKLAEAVRGKKVDENKLIKDAIVAKDWNTAAELISNSQTGAGKEYMPLIAKYLIPEQQKNT